MKQSVRSLLKKTFSTNGLALIICAAFFCAYTTLSVIRHFHFGSFGFDLGITDQIIWKYSQLKAPITTVHFNAFSLIFADHIEFIYLFLAPFYWIYSSPVTILILQAFFLSFSGIPIYLLAKENKLKKPIAISVLIAYLSFYGIQNAIWFDVHSTTFAAAIIPWFIYFLSIDKKRSAIAAFLLVLLTKEDMALLTFLISLVFFLKKRNSLTLIIAGLSIMYLVFVFLIYFPFFTQRGYIHTGGGSVIASINPYYLFDTKEKQMVFFYSFGWYGFLSLLSPLFILPVLGDLFHYFVFAKNQSAIHGLYMHYRVTLSALLVWPLIITIRKYRKLNTTIFAVVLLIIVSLLQYSLHVPLTYLTKKWFWTKPSSYASLNTVLASVPKNASIVVQNNLTPHITHRDEIFTLWPEKKEFLSPTMCNEKLCNWFRWSGQPEYLIVDTAPEWDIRHLLANREVFLDGLNNLGRNKIIEKKIQKGTTILYRIKNN